jgi:hypothetical protein
MRELALVEVEAAPVGVAGDVFWAEVMNVSVRELAGLGKLCDFSQTCSRFPESSLSS